MTTKTLGQVARDADTLGNISFNESAIAENYERIAQAVAAVVRERDASLADVYPECWQAIQIAANIRKQSA